MLGKAVVETSLQRGETMQNTGQTSAVGLPCVGFVLRSVAEKSVTLCNDFCDASRMTKRRVAGQVITCGRQVWDASCGSDDGRAPSDWTRLSAGDRPQRSGDAKWVLYNFFLMVNKKCVFLQVMSKPRLIVLVAVTLCALCGCKGYNDLLKSTDYEAQYNAAVKYYEDGAYTRASQLFEKLQLHYRGRDLSENICWYYGQTVMKQNDYYAAAYQFSTFTRRFPYSERAEEAAYLAAYCKYRQSPEYSLDQSFTRLAVKELEHFVEQYPNSVHIPEVNGYLDVLRAKLMKKDYEIALEYYRIEAYHAAYEALGSYLNEYFDATNREEAMFYQLLSGFEYAINSREDKMYERLQNVVSDFDKFASLYYESPHISKAQDIYTKTKAALYKLEQQPQDAKQINP